MPNLFDLSGKTAIVTGSSKGIGKAIAHRLAEHGANVVVSSRKADACAEAVAEINKLVGREAAVAIPANIASKDALQALVDETNKRFGQIDITICNAASNPHFGSMLTISDEQFTKILQNNIVSNHWLIQMTVPQMRARQEGAIIIISSVGGLKASPVIGAYNISKAADMQMARNYALEFGSRLASSAPISRRRCGKIRRSWSSIQAAPASSALESRMTLPAWRCSSLHPPARSRPGKLSSLMAGSWPSDQDGSSQRRVTPILLKNASSWLTTSKAPS
jgi:NADP-dependent 3-hydroxy acid dehydrogenase YdfG